MTHISYERVLRVFLLPSLDTVFLLNCTAVPSSENESSMWLLTQGCSDVATIHLTSSIISSSVLARMIRACEALKSFCYVDSDIPETSEAVEWYEELIEAMTTHQDTLEQLMLEAWEDSDSQWSHRYTCLKVLAGMKALQSLYIDYTILRGKPSGEYEIENSVRVPEATWPGYTHALQDILPPNLLKLCLKYDRLALTLDVDYTAQLLHLLASVRSQFPLLDCMEARYVHCQSAGEFPLQLHVIKDEAREAGLNFDCECVGFIEDEGMCIDMNVQPTYVR
jgi:hypothetical protein